MARSGRIHLHLQILEAKRLRIVAIERLRNVTMFSN